MGVQNKFTRNESIVLSKVIDDDGERVVQYCWLYTNGQSCYSFRRTYTTRTSGGLTSGPPPPYEVYMHDQGPCKMVRVKEVVKSDETAYH